MSLWDYAKEPEEEEYRGRTLRSYFLDLERGNTRLGLAGKIFSAAEARQCLQEGYDYVTLGRAAILHHDFPMQVEAASEFKMKELPVTREYLQKEGLGDNFLEYMSRWPDFIAD
jgi:2,4-dienoyl-CoA reductase-like NADH-dependent reductase (Old Yellow Enzyme family)